MKIGFEYIKYRRKAKHRHGIHSPFVYNFTDVCLRTKIDERDKMTIQKVVSRLRKDTRSIEIDDHGAGSKKMGKSRKVRSILKNSSSKGKYGQLLYKICRHYKPENILELGTSLGIGTIQMSLGNPDSIVTTIEGCSNTRAIAMENFNFAQVAPDSRHDTFDHFLQTNGSKFDLVFIDGHHDGRALLHYMSLLQPMTHEDTLFILDDIRWSDSMYSAWKELYNNDKYHLSMDLFRMGILSRKNSQAKENFTIRL